MQAKIEESTFELPTPPNETDSGIMLSQRLFLDAADFTSTFLLQMAKCIAADGSYIELEDQAYCTQKTWQLRDAPGHSDCSAGPKDTTLSVLSFDHMSHNYGGPTNEVISHTLVAGTSDPPPTSCTEYTTCTICTTCTECTDCIDAAEAAVAVGRTQKCMLVRAGPSLPGEPVQLGSVDGGCATNPCTPGHACSYSQFSLKCTPCESGLYSDDGLSCKACPPGTQPNAGRSGCEACTGANFSKTGTCIECPAPNIVEDSFRACNPCAAGEGPNDNNTACESCGPTEYGLGVCQTCVLPNIVSADGASCGPCAAGEGPNSAGSSCEQCAEGSVNDGQSGQCTACGPGETSNAGRTACVDLDECRVGNGGCDPRATCGAVPNGTEFGQCLNGCINRDHTQGARRAYECGPCPAGFEAVNGTLGGLDGQGQLRGSFCELPPPPPPSSGKASVQPSTTLRMSNLSPTVLDEGHPDRDALTAALRQDLATSMGVDLSLVMK